MWNINTVKKLSKLQKRLIASAYKVLKDGGVMVYSTCTHAPEENESVINFALQKLGMKIETIKLPIKYSHGLEEWGGLIFDKQVTKSCRIYPQDSGTDGFFIAKLRK